jgi:hypothetical protein
MDNIGRACRQAINESLCDFRHVAASRMGSADTVPLAG